MVMIFCATVPLVKQILLQDPIVREEYEKLGPLYEIKRAMIELRQKELAQRVGTRQSTISRLENGTYNPSGSFLAKVAHAMGKQVSISFK
ncbi:MAG: helix-turn-helix domain-containing protein [Negativicutes bacterium]